MIEAYPLYWPENWSRTAPHHRQRSRFNTSMGMARDGLLYEARLLSGRNIVLSTNVPVRRDGLPYASAREPDDPGVAVYFDLNGEQRCIPCDKWDLVRDNLRAVEKTIGALRGLDRWGAKEMVDAAFRGFAALPPPGGHWTEVLGVAHDATPDQIKSSYREKAKVLHPDAGGSVDQFQALQDAFKRASA